MSKFSILFLLLFTIFNDLYSERVVIDLCKNNNWRVWLDRNAQWENDKLILPNELDLLKLPINLPTCGWDSLYNEKGIKCKLPTTIEEQFGTSHDWTYKGVSWFFNEFKLPVQFKGKRIFLYIEKYNHRIEVFVNGKLVGYDAVGLVPYQCDISNALISGNNRIALRITGVGGNRGWEDFKMIKWGDNLLLPDKDYSGIGGSVNLIVLDNIYISDVFVKNVLPVKGNQIEVEANLYNDSNNKVESEYSIEIVDKKTKEVLLKKDFNCLLQTGDNFINNNLVVENAKIWSENNPYLYDCRIKLKTNNSCDFYEQQFGFRIFEVKEKDGHTHFYLNGERIRFRSSIDWGIYAYNGMFPTQEVAKRNIEAVKAVGHNSLNFHRRLGDTSIFNNADSLGVYIYEEPGGFHCGGQGNCNIEVSDFAKGQITERIKRMVLRDRNHPSLLIYALCNEDNKWTQLREKSMRYINELDPTRLIINTSGGNSGGFTNDGVHHIRPYEDKIRMDYKDHHTVRAQVTLMESDLKCEASKIYNNKGERIHHVSNDSTSITYWGEVRCYAGTFNYPLLYKQGIVNGKGYDISMYKSQYYKIKELFDNCNFPNIESCYDLTKYAGQGQYYTNGRLEQMIMCNDFSDGYAINGWTPGPDMPDEWYSAMLDQNRNMNSFPENTSYWNRPLQLAIMRQNGKYFIPDDTIKVNVFLINENKLSSGNYSLSLFVKDGNGRQFDLKKNINITVKGGDIYSQTVYKDFPIVVRREWASGYVSIIGKLYKGNRIVADGMEQVLLKNRITQKRRLNGINISVIDWPCAEKALKEAGITTSPFLEKSSIVLMGNNYDDKTIDNILAVVRKGAKLIIKLDSTNSKILFQKGVLSTPLKIYNGYQTGYWNGNGSSYISVFGGNQVIYKSKVISSRSWEVSGDPIGFFPFRSDYKKNIYGLYFAHQNKRNPKFNDDNNTLVTYGEIEYGNGKILLSASYIVDEENAFTDLLFFNILDFYNKK